MYRVEPRHKFSVDITRADYIQPIDYLRPAIGGFTIGLAYMTFVSLICTLLDPERATVVLSVGGVGAIMSAWMYSLMALIAAGTVHCVWHSRLKQEGPGAFERRISVQIPARQAFELCLAASSQIKNQRLIGMDDQKGEIRVQTPPLCFLYENTDVDIRLFETIDGVTHISISAQKAITQLRMEMLKMMWGEKWIPLILCVGNRDQHEKVMDELADRILAMPNWNYAHQSHQCLEEKAS